MALSELAQSVEFGLLPEPLATDVQSSLERSIAGGAVFERGGTPLEVFQHTVDSAIRNIRQHPRGELLHGANPVMRWMASDATVRMDSAGNIKLQPGEDRRRRRRDHGPGAGDGQGGKDARLPGDGATWGWRRSEWCRPAAMPDSCPATRTARG